MNKFEQLSMFEFLKLGRIVTTLPKDITSLLSNVATHIRNFTLDCGICVMCLSKEHPKSFAGHHACSACQDLVMHGQTQQLLILSTILTVFPDAETHSQELTLALEDLGQFENRFLSWEKAQIFLPSIQARIKGWIKRLIHELQQQGFCFSCLQDRRIQGMCLTCNKTPV